MPTIQEEMNKVLNEWNKPKEEPMTQHLTKNQFGVTNNVTRVTFDYVKANPGVTATEAANALGKDGYKASSVTAIMAQMARSGTMRKEGYKYFTTTDTYTPIKLWKKTDKTLKVEKAIAKVEKLAERAWQGPKEKPTITVKDIVENMTMREARELYAELGKYFGA